MIKIEKIRIVEFRGIRDLTIELQGKSFAICGKNGTGKSGVVDALEFGLTGNISRLSGKGMGTISLKEHAPHVDSKNHPEKAKVIIYAFIPSLKKSVTIERSVKEPSNPTVTPTDPDIQKSLSIVENHPEFALSRRELIRYVISTPGDRAKEVQALLQLDQIENLRTILQKIANGYARDVPQRMAERESCLRQLLVGIGIDEYSTPKLVESVNSRRKVLGLEAINNTTDSFTEGLATPKPGVLTRVPKVQALADLKRLNELFASVKSEETKQLILAILQEMTALNEDKVLLSQVNKENFLKTALELIENQLCPVCDTEWELEELKDIIGGKLEKFATASKLRKKIEGDIVQYTKLLIDIGQTLRTIESYGPLLNPVVDVSFVTAYREKLGVKYRVLDSFIPLESTIEHLNTYSDMQSEVLDAVAMITASVESIPDPSEQDAARDYLILAQERYQKFKDAFFLHKKIAQKAETSKKVFEVYAKTTTEVLNGIYKKVEKDFGEYYRMINQDDEAAFTAQLTPSIGKLGFDVDFYGRGFFPPGAYHSEGHQDGMGLCLYLALMKHLQGEAFTFAVLDDVLMSVDSGHRREVCELLKTKFPNTQFVFTTHDEIWLRHMKTAGLIANNSFLQFRKWDVDNGPTQWNNRDVWKEIEGYLANDDVRAAAGLLRHFLEYISAEICNSLRASVEFRGDYQFELGDLLPSAISRFKKILKEGKATAVSWKDTASEESITAKEGRFDALVAASTIDQWQINPAVHYNEWANFHKNDFKPVADAFKGLMEAFSCDTCGSLYYLTFTRGSKDSCKCSCGALNINLRKK